MKTIKQILIALSVVMIALIAAACPQSGSDTAPATRVSGTTAANQAGEDTSPAAFKGKDFRFTTFDGVEHKLSDYAGKPVVLNFFGVT